MTVALILLVGILSAAVIGLACYAFGLVEQRDEARAAHARCKAMKP